MVRKKKLSPSGATDENGDYLFSGLPAGTYIISIDDEAVFEPSNQTVNLPPNQEDINFIQSPAPAISLAKSADRQVFTREDEVITYTFTAKNTGNVTLTAVTITDDLKDLSDLDCTPALSATLLPGESLVCTATYTTTVEDVNNRKVENTATVTGTPATIGSEVSDTDSAVVTDGMACIPAGEFQMGCHPDHNGGHDCPTEELPLHTVYLDAFFIDINHVTNAQYAECVAAEGCTELSDTFKYNNSVYANHPVVHVNWAQADAYCTWANKVLPTEAQWEKAARGPTVRAFPWGDAAATCEHANFNLCVGDTSAVGSYPDYASPYGVLDMAGNVWDWINDWYLGTAYLDRACGMGDDPACDNPTGPGSGTRKVLRGGSWSNVWSHLFRAAYRETYFPEDDAHHVGFRCVSALP